MKKTDEQSAKAQQPTTITIKKANLRILPLIIEGTAPYVQHRFHKKADIMLAQQQDKTERSKQKERKARDFEADYRAACHVGTDGKYGIPAAALRRGAISACRLIGFKMTLAKLAIFTLPDSFDADGTPLVHISGKPEMRTDPVPNANGSIDVRARPMWAPGWRAKLRIQFDADVFSPSDVANLIDRVGQQVGIGEGRHDSKESSGVGWGTFRVVTDD
jgi:hypothetical protein